MVLLNNWRGGYGFPCLWQSNKKLKPVDFHSNSAGLTYPEERSELASELRKEKQRGTLRAVFKNSAEFKPFPQHPAAGQGDYTHTPPPMPITKRFLCPSDPRNQLLSQPMQLGQDAPGCSGSSGGSAQDAGTHKSSSVPFINDEKTHGNSTKALVVVGYLDTTHNTSQVKSKEIIDLLKSKKQPPRF